MKKYYSFIILLLFFTVACGQIEPEQNGVTERTDSELPSEADQEITENDRIEKDEEFTEESLDTADLHPVSLYFVDNDLMNIYRVDEDLSLPMNEDGAKAALEHWINGPVPDGLQRNIPEGVVVQSVRSDNGIAFVSFSNDLQNANLGSSGEAFLIEQIVMIVEQFGFSHTKVLIDGEEKDTLLGHIDLSEPFEAKSPTEFETFSPY